MIQQKPKCAWLSRHAPTEAQIASLHQYQIVQVAPSRRLLSAQDAFNLASGRCGGMPSLFVVVLPDEWEAQFVALVQTALPGTPVLHARMRRPLYNVWSGEWRALEVVNGVLTWYEWVPEEVR